MILIGERSFLRMNRLKKRVDECPSRRKGDDDNAGNERCGVEAGLILSRFVWAP